MKFKLARFVLLSTAFLMFTDAANWAQDRGVPVREGIAFARDTALAPLDWDRNDLAAAGLVAFLALFARFIMRGVYASTFRPVVGYAVDSVRNLRTRDGKFTSLLAHLERKSPFTAWCVSGGGDRYGADSPVIAAQSISQGDLALLSRRCKKRGWSVGRAQKVIYIFESPTPQRGYEAI